MKKYLALAALAVAALVPAAQAATSDQADPSFTTSGLTATFHQDSPCTRSCQLTWRRPDIGLTRYGGVIIGYGSTISYTFPAAGTYPVRLDLSQACSPGGRLVCHDYATVYVAVSG